MAATFGRDGITTSYAEFVIPQQLLPELEYHVDVSFFVRTTKPSGIVLYLGSDRTSSGGAQSAVVVELVIGGLKSTLQIGSQTQSYLSSSLLANGQQHFVKIIRDNSSLTVALDGNVTSYAVTVPLILAAEVLYVGGVPASYWPQRRKRDTALGGSFSGTLQDLRINGAVAEFFSQNLSVNVTSTVLSPVLLSNVSAGEHSDDVCSTLNPCQNNGSCVNVFYNDYRFLSTIVLIFNLL